MTAVLDVQAVNLQYGDHVCMIYQDPAELTAAVGPFVKEALSRKACCVYVADGSNMEEVASLLEVAGIPVDQEEERGTLQFLDKWDFRRVQDLGPEAVVETIQDLVDQALARGLTGLWLIIDMTWTLDPAVGHERLLRWEALANTAMAANPTVALCIYHRQQFAPADLRGSLLTHPLVVLQENIHPNFYYEPPELVLDSAASDAKVDWMLARLQQVHNERHELRESERCYRLLAENARDMVFRQRLVPRFEFDYVSPSVTALTGYTPEEFYADPELGRKLVHPDDDQLLKMLRCFPDYFNKPVALRFTHRDGTLRWVEHNVTPVYDVQGHLVAVEGIVRDITDRKTMETELVRRTEELAHSQEQLRLLLEGVQDYAISMLDPNGYICSWNSGAERIRGYRAEEIIGKHFSCFYPQEDIESGKPRRHLRTAAADGKVEEEGWRVRKDGSRFWANMVMTALRDQDGHLRGFAQVTRDITERRRIEEQRLRLRELAWEEQERRRLQTFIDASLAGVIVVDAPTEHIVMVNPEAQRILGVSYQRGKRLEECDLGTVYRRPDGQRYAPEEFPLRRTLRRGETVRAEEMRVESSGGTSITTLVNSTPVYGADGQIATAIGVIQDITPLEQVEKLRSEFLGMVSHELRTPLAVIKGSAAVVMGSSRPLDSRETREFFQVIDEQADQLRELVDDLLDLTRIEAGSFTVSTEPVDLRAILLEARAIFARSGAAHEVQIEAPEGLPRVKADRRRVIQVLVNLLTNAAKFSTNASPIKIEAESDPVHVTVHVRDQGRGIPRDRLPHIFKKFFQVHEESGRKLSGSGLGLAIAKGIVEAHGGRIHAHSQGEGRGATISFTLPVAGPAGAPPSALEHSNGAATVEHRGSRRFRVLAVDDDPQFQYYIRRFLLDSGYHPIVTGDPAQVGRVMQAERPDLVLLDLILPGASGFDLLQEIHELSEVPVIFLTARDGDGDAARALKMGADDYITKPFSSVELAARLEAALRRRGMMDIARGLPPFVLGDLTINFTARDVTVADQSISLTPTEYELLCVLATNAGRVLTYEQILSMVWGTEYAGDAPLVYSFVCNLRRKLGDDGRKPRYILTEPRVGYRMPRGDKVHRPY